MSYDDLDYVVENPHLPAGLSRASLARAFAAPYFYNWTPLTSVSLLLDYSLFGFDPAGYHLVNLALHLASSLLLYATLRRATREPWPSAFAAAVFALHPLHVESVAWVSERKDVLAGLFWMLSMRAYLAWCERPSAARYGALFAALGLGLLSKPMLVTLPGALLLLDVWPLARLGRGVSARRAVLEKLPLLALAVGFAALTFWVQHATGAVARAAALPFGLRLGNALDSYLQYLAASLWPARLAVFYPHPQGSLPVPRVALAVALLAAITAAALLRARSRPYLAVGWLWFLGTLVPVIGLVQIGMHARADRYTYIPLIGLALAVAWTGRDLARRGPGPRRAVAAAGLCAAIAMALASHRQAATWRDSVSLYEHALEAVPGNFLAHYGLAGVLGGAGREGEVEPHLRAAIASEPGFSRAHAALGDLLLRQGRHAEALRSYESALRLGGQEPELRAARQRARALVLEGRGDLAAALAEVEAGLALLPAEAALHGLRGRLLLRQGRPGDALASLVRAAELGLRTAELHAGLAEVALARGEMHEATRQYAEALRLEPGRPELVNNLAWLLATSADASLRDPTAALALLGSARLGSSEDPALLDTQAAAHAAAGHFEEAVAAAERAARGAERAGSDALAAGIRARLALYRARRPYVEAPPPGGG